MYVKPWRFPIARFHHYTAALADSPGRFAEAGDFKKHRHALPASGRRTTGRHTFVDSNPCACFLQAPRCNRSGPNQNGHTYTKIIYI